jgi:hypothetical protein
MSARHLIGDRCAGGDPKRKTLQKLCGSRFGWPASKTLAVAQELYDGQGKKIITYPRGTPRCATCRRA